jgi:hypothetical protein
VYPLSRNKEDINVTTIKATGEQITETREELAKRYFGGLDFYAKGNKGIVSLLSDLQEFVGMSGGRSAEHYRQVLNDIKYVLCENHNK